MAHVSCMPPLRASSIIACLVTNISTPTCELSLYNCCKFAPSTSGFHHGMYAYMQSLRSFIFFPFDAFHVLVVHFDLFFASQSTFWVICWDWVEHGVCWCFACMNDSFAKKKVAQFLNDSVSCSISFSPQMFWIFSTLFFFRTFLTSHLQVRIWRPWHLIFLYCFHTVFLPHKKKVSMTSWIQKLIEEKTMPGKTKKGQSFLVEKR